MSKEPGAGKFFKKVSRADPLARSRPSKPAEPVADDKLYSPPASSKFDFILNSRQNSGPRFTWLSSIPRSILIPVLAVVVLFGFIFVSSTLNSHKNAWVRQMNDLMARQQEILRVSSLAKQIVKGPSVNLDSTMLATLQSDFIQTGAYLKSQHVKVNTKKLSLYLDKNAAAKLRSAAQDNSADDYYAQYIAQKLVDYQKAIKSTFPLVGPNAKKLLNDYYQSAGVILTRLDLPTDSS